MAIHAGFRRWNSRVSRRLHAGMTVPAVDSVVSYVVFVAELNGLHARYTLVSNIRRSRHDQHSGQPESGKEYESGQTKPRDEIETAVKNLGHVKFAPEGTGSPRAPTSQEECSLLCQPARVPLTMRANSFHQIPPDCNLQSKMATAQFMVRKLQKYLQFQRFREKNPGQTWRSERHCSFSNELTHGHAISIPYGQPLSIPGLLMATCVLSFFMSFVARLAAKPTCFGFAASSLTTPLGRGPTGRTPHC